MSLLSRFRSNERGNVAMLFGLAVVPAVMAMGIAVDYSRVSNARTEMQAAVDAAAVSAARAAARMSERDFQNYAKAMFEGNLGNPYFTVDTFAAQRGDRVVSASAEGTMPTSLMSVFGFKTLAVKAKAEVAWKSNKIEVAMVLDTTGSMSKNNKIYEMKKAANSLIDILSTNSYTADSARIAVVPFNSQVRVDTKYRNASWLYTELDDANYRNHSQEQWAAYYATTRQDWQGCISNRERAGNYDVSNKPATADLRATGHWASLCGADPNNRNLDQARITPLSNNFNSLKSGINALPALGATNITLGVTWGMETLSSTGVFANAAPASDETLKFMIVLTDGDNTVDRVTAYADNLNNSNDVARIKAMNSRTSQACSAAKVTGIKVYTIRVMDGDANLLRNCASDDSKYYDVQTASQLDGVFRSIAQEIAQVRLTN